MSNPSICIPKVNKNISKKFIYDTFNRHNFGEISKIDMVKMNKGLKYLFILNFGLIISKA